MVLDARLLPREIDGELIHLHAWEVDDAPRIEAAVGRNLEHLRPWMPWIADEPLDLDARRALLTRWTVDRDAGLGANFAILVDDEVVGGCGLHRRIGDESLEIGYWVDADHVGRGIATAASAMLTTAATRDAGATYVEIRHDEANAASRRVPEKLGYRLLGTFPDEITAPGEVGIEWRWRIKGDEWDR
jgi:RimJ/RimL family protein N-acetyltransferase